MKSGNFFGELKRRNVYKVAVAYAVVGWLLIQVATQVFPFLDIPNWAIRLVILLTALGFPIALIIAWAFELTPEGIRRTEDADAAGQRSRGGIWMALVVIAAALSLGLFFLGRYSAGNARSQNPALRGSGVASSEAVTALPEKSVAVLPLLNESGDPKDEYFADGLSEELIAALAQINGLKVIGRSSSFRFKDRHEEPKTIGEKLGVSTLLEGTVRKQDDRVRIVAELVNAADGIALWTRTFDRELKDIFAVQEEIARAVAESLKVTCSDRRIGRHKEVLPAMWRRTMPTSRATFIFSVVISKTIVKLWATSIRRSGSIPIMPWLTPSAPKPGVLLETSPVNMSQHGQTRGAMRKRQSRSRLRWPRHARPSDGFAFLSIGSSLKE